jgi:hypothetical protein
MSKVGTKLRGLLKDQWGVGTTTSNSTIETRKGYFVNTRKIPAGDINARGRQIEQNRNLTRG